MADSDIQADTASSPLIEPGLAQEFGKIGAALRKNPLFPEVSYTLHWRDPIRTGLLFGIVNLAYFLVIYGEYSIVTLFNYCALALLATAFAYAYGLILWARYVQGSVIENPLSSRWANSKIVISRTVVEKHTDSFLALVNAILDVLRDVYYCIFPVLSLKFAALSLTFAIFGNCFSGVTICYLALVVLFAWPRLYEEKKALIDQYYTLVHDQIKTYVNLAISKLPLPKPVVADKRKTK